MKTEDQLEGIVTNRELWREVFEPLGIPWATCKSYLYLGRYGVLANYGRKIEVEGAPGTARCYKIEDVEDWLKEQDWLRIKEKKEIQERLNTLKREAVNAI